MTNRPNRNWRAQARQQAEVFVAEHSILWEFLPTTPANLQERLRQVFEAGFAAGREQNRPRKKSDDQ